MEERRLLVATTNAGKAAEIARILAGLPLQIISLAGLDPLPEAEETGETFAENALLKADHYHRLTGMLVLADDSGLCVDALGGAPGIYSARYAASSSEMVPKLLAALEGVPEEKRTARFVCAVAVVGEGRREVFHGECEGRIAFEPSGSGGFGYDPVFIDPETGLTFAELSPEQKAARSHRGRALEAAREMLSRER